MKYYIIGVLFSQKFSLKSGLKKFGNTGEKFSVKELTQIHDMTTFIPLNPKKLTIEDIIKDLSSLIFLVEKLYGTIKAITCADGIKQRSYDSYKNMIVLTQLVQIIVS